MANDPSKTALMAATVIVQVLVKKGLVSVAEVAEAIQEIAVVYREDGRHEEASALHAWSEMLLRSTPDPR